MNRPTIIGDCFEQWVKYAKGKQTIAFAPSVMFSKNLVDDFLSKGVSAKHLDGETDSIEREQAVRDYSAGKITLLSNCNLFVEGFNVPRVEAMLNCKPTKSLARYLQAVGRVLRKAEGKEFAIILDQVNACLEHGLPDDEYEFSLDDREGKRAKKGDKADAPTKVCLSCFAANHAINRYCKNCGAPFVVKERTGPSQIDGDLTEVDKAEFRKRRKMEEKSAKTLDEQIALGVARGYKNPEYWARMKFKYKNMKKGDAEK